MARKLAPPEPMDYEWKRLDLDPLQRASNGLAWLLLAFGAVGLTIWGMIKVTGSNLETVPKSLVLALMVGSIVLFLTTLRARLRTLPFDRYTGVER